MLLHSDPAPAIKSALTFLGRGQVGDPLNYDPRGIEKNSTAMHESYENFRNWYNGASDWEKNDFATEAA